MSTCEHRIIYLGGMNHAYSSKFQRTVALSAAEGEYMALSMCVQYVLWTRALLTDMEMCQRNATTIWEDNQGAITLAQNAGRHTRTKHVDIRHRFVRGNVERGTVKVEYVDTKKQLVHIMTKALATKLLNFLRDGSNIKEKVAIP
ncbi:unnamed protein product [Phytophthora fragariaefolia]|uniref:Unnamed protein product n=1 Tax=Phytophthora fragariaefolia TaxID=1490495 RepID=A0A9W6XQ80_9STRA|nr:unnamed protein product [Phytophthora fragariaefolia]